MSTYKVRVEDKVGLVGDDTALSDFLTAGAKYITNILPPERVEKYTTNVPDAGSGVSVTTYRISGANLNGQGARRIDQNLALKSTDVGSIHKATTSDPIYYILNGSAYIKPSGGNVVAMAYPTVAYGDSTITAFPVDLDEGVVLYASIQARIRQLSDLITTIGGLSFTEQSSPVAPASPSFTYTDATVGTIASTSVTFTDTLSYIPPVFEGSFTNTDTALTNQDIELANAHLNKVQSQLEEMQKNLLNSLNEFNKDKGEFDANLQIALTNAQLTQQRLTEAAQLSTNVSLQNEAKEYERQVQEYQAKLSLYGQEMSGYSAVIGQEVQRINARLSQYSAEVQILTVGLQSLRLEFTEFLKAI